MTCFSELFCARQRVDPARYADTMFWRCLHRRTWPVAGIIKVIARDYFQPDYELIRSVGQLSSTKELRDELANFNFHPGNHGWMRRRLKFRVSGRKLYRVVSDILPSASESSSPQMASVTSEAEAATLAPFKR
jgi:hypothetical protein